MRTPKVLENLRALARALDEHDAFGGASAIAFDGFFSLVPLIAVAGWVIRRLVDASPAVLDPLLRLTPAAFAAMADLELMRAQRTGAPWMAPLSIAAFAWLASSGGARALLHFERIHNAAGRAWWRRRLVALGFAVGGLIVTGLAVTVGVRFVMKVPGSGDVVALALSFASLWLLVGLFYRYATPRPVGTPRHGFRCAGLTVGSWTLISMIFGYYVQEFADYTKFYGSLATVAVVLVWMWLMALALLVGGEVNALFEAASKRPRHPFP